MSYVVLLLRLELYVVVLCNSGVAVGVLTSICYFLSFFCRSQAPVENSR